MRSTMSAYFTVGSILSLTGLTIGGQVRSEHLVAAATLLPFMVAGLWLSNLVIRRANKTVLYRVAVGASIIGALLVIGEVTASLFSL